MKKIRISNNRYITKKKIPFYNFVNAFEVIEEKKYIFIYVLYNIIFQNVQLAERTN